MVSTIKKTTISEGVKSSATLESLHMTYNRFTTIPLNNYQDRIITPKKTKLSEYDLHFASYTEDISFNTGDGINTTQIVNYDPSLYNQNYAIFSDVNGKVLSVWFIMESVRLRSGQYNLVLRRDVIAEHYSNLKESIAFIQKGIIRDVDNPLLFNKEAMGYNQIKYNSDINLLDKSKVQWIYIYLPKNKTFDSSITIPAEYTGDAIYIGSDIANWKYNSSKLVGGETTIKWVFRGWSKRVEEPKKYNYLINYSDGTLYNIKLTSEQIGDVYVEDNKLTDSSDRYYEEGGPDDWFEDLRLLIPELMSEAEEENLLSYDGKLVRDDNKVYRVSVVRTGKTSNGPVKRGTNLFNRMLSFFGNWTKGNTINNANNNQFRYDIHGNIYSVVLSTVGSTGGTLTINNSRRRTVDALYDIIAIPYNGEDGQGLGIRKTDVTGVWIRTDPVISRNAAVEIGKQIGSEIYDIQLLPYCPLQNHLWKSQLKTISLQNLTEGKDYDWIKNNNDDKAIIFYLQNASFNFNIEQSIKIYDPSSDITTTTETGQYVNSSPVLNGEYAMEIGSDDINKNPTIISAETQEGDDVTYDYNIKLSTFDNDTYIVITGPKSSANVNVATIIKYAYDVTHTASTEEKEKNKIIAYKVSNECDIYRLVSPNYASSFEFSPAKNDGVDYFEVSVTLKPINPYIKIKPSFKGLYGNNPKYDARGLILNGDFSFGQLQSSFINYEIQNKNYQEIFNRQIEKMDFDNKLGKIEAVTGAITGTVQGAGTGAAAGALVGGPWGAAAGAAVGGITSAIGGVADVAIYDKKVAENRRYTIDMYNYQLGNIKALSYSLAKTSAQNVNYHIFPFIEIYTATDDEKSILKDKLKYDGYTIMEIAEIGKYLVDVEKSYIKCELIRSSKISVDNNEMTAIYNELAKGVYM